MSPTDEIIQEVDSLEEATNEAIQALAVSINLTSSLVEEHASKIEELDERVGRLEDLVDTVDNQERNMGDILRRLQALERIPVKPELKRLHELEAQARTLGANWAEVEVYERHDGMLVINHFLGQRSMIEDRIAQSEATKLAAPKTSPTC